jgi:hypothetical protein
MGVHSPVDIFGGLFLGLFTSLLVERNASLIISSLYRTSYISAALQLLSLFWFSFFYPKCRPWRASYGTAAQIYGTWIGCASSLLYVNTFQLNLKASLEKASLVAMNVVTAYFEQNSLQLNETDVRDTLSRLGIGLLAAAISKIATKYIILKLFLWFHRQRIITHHQDDLKDDSGLYLCTYLQILGAHTYKIYYRKNSPAGEVI